MVNSNMITVSFAAIMIEYDILELSTIEYVG